MTRISCLAACALLLTACGVARTRAPVVPPLGVLFSNLRAPMQVHFEDTTLGPKRGTAQITYIMEPFLGTSYAWGDASIEEAARDGQISTVHHADYEMLSVLGLYVRYTTYAYGD